MSTYREGATFSDDMVYRYRLWRRWDDLIMPVMWLMLNPSTATAFTSDPTVERCIRRSRQMGYGGVEVCNLYALRSTDPKLLHPPATQDPIGPENIEEIVAAANLSAAVVLGWGSHGNKIVRGWPRTVLRAIKHKPLFALDTNADGQPKHPLYIAYEKQPKEYIFEDD